MSGFDSLSLEELAGAWVHHKEAERQAVEVRRQIEDAMAKKFGLREDSERSETFQLDQYRVVVAQRINRKVNSDLVHQIAQEYGLMEHIGGLFKWEPEFSVRAWKAADPLITKRLEVAITATPGRPSFKIEPIKKDLQNV